VLCVPAALVQWSDPGIILPQTIENVYTYCECQKSVKLAFPVQK